MADVILAGAEQELMMAYINAFQIPEDSIKNNYSIF